MICWNLFINRPQEGAAFSQMKLRVLAQSRSEFDQKKSESLLSKDRKISSWRASLKTDSIQ